jgi:hypothetical protein
VAGCAGLTGWTPVKEPALAPGARSGVLALDEVEEDDPAAEWGEKVTDEEYAAS